MNTLFRLCPAAFVNKPQRLFVVVHQDNTEKEFEHEQNCLNYIRELFAKDERFYVKSRVTVEEIVDIIPVR